MSPHEISIHVYPIDCDCVGRDGRPVPVPDEWRRLFPHWPTEVDGTRGHDQSTPDGATGAARAGGS